MRQKRKPETTTRRTRRRSGARSPQRVLQSF
jgi:hypothetical protein